MRLCWVSEICLAICFKSEYEDFFIVAVPSFLNKIEGEKEVCNFEEGHDVERMANEIQATSVSCVKWRPKLG